MEALKGFGGRQGGFGAAAVMCGALWGQGSEVEGHRRKTWTGQALKGFGGRQGGFGAAAAMRGALWGQGSEVEGHRRKTWTGIGDIKRVLRAGREDLGLQL